MSYEIKDNSGSLFRNERKEPGSKQPDYSGTVKVNGAELQIAAWLKEAKSGKKYMSLSFSPPYRKETKVAGDDDAPPPKKGADFDDDLPF